MKRRSLFVLVQKHRSIDELEEKMKTLQIEGKNCSALGTLLLPVGELLVLPQSRLGDPSESRSVLGACRRLHTRGTVCQSRSTLCTRICYSVSLVQCKTLFPDLFSMGYQVSVSRDQPHRYGGGQKKVNTAVFEQLENQSCSQLSEIKKLLGFSSSWQGQAHLSCQAEQL